MAHQQESFLPFSSRQSLSCCLSHMAKRSTPKPRGPLPSPPKPHSPPLFTLPKLCDHLPSPSKPCGPPLYVSLHQHHHEHMGNSVLCYDVTRQLELFSSIIISWDHYCICSVTDQNVMWCMTVFFSVSVNPMLWMMRNIAHWDSLHFVPSSCALLFTLFPIFILVIIINLNTMLKLWILD